MAMLTSRRANIVRLNVVILESLAQAAVNAHGDQLITIVGNIVDHAPAGESLSSLLPVEGGSHVLNEYRAHKDIVALTSLRDVSETMDMQIGFHLYHGLSITCIVV